MTMTKKRKRQAALCTAVLVLMTGVYGCGTEEATVQEIETGEPAVQSEEEPSGAAVPASGNTEQKKEETVYVKADADGSVKEIIVSDILRNAGALPELKDRSDLTGIKNVKGKETFQKESDGTLIWQADGNDICYQGKTKKTLPIELKVTYYLDGEEMNPKRMAGKSGHIKIRFDYINHETKTVNINGEDRTISTPFVVVTGLFLDEEKFVNVEMENGRVISDGSRIMAGGMTVPGLSASIALSEVENMDDLDLPEYLELTAYTTDFELPFTMTAITSDFSEEIDLDDLEQYEDLKDDMQELKDASVELVDGTHELVDGVQELKDGSEELYDGAVELDDGAKKIHDGAVQLDNGAFEIQDGAVDLKEALKQFNAGLDTLAAPMSNADGNGKDIAAVAAELSAGVDQVVDQVLGSMVDQVNAMAGSYGLSFGSVDEFLAFDADSLAGTLEGAVQAGQMTEEEAAGLIQMIKGTQAQLKESYTSLMTLKGGMSGLSAGIGQIYSGVTTQLQPAASQILDGSRKLLEGTKELKEGTEELVDGSAELKDGTAELLDGTVELKDGVQELYDGSIELRDGMEEFDRDGIQKLYDMVCGDMQKVLDRARAAADQGEAYQTFTQLAPGMKGSVKFLIETEAID